MPSNRAHGGPPCGLPNHDSRRRLQHEARAQAITSAIDSHVQAEQRGHEDDGQAGVLAPVG